MVARVLVAGAALAAGAQIPIIARGGVIMAWFYVLPVVLVCVFLCAFAVCSEGVESKPKDVVAAVVAAGAYAVLVAPRTIISAEFEMVSASLGSGCLVVLALRLRSRLSRIVGWRSWMALGAGLVGTGMLFLGGARRFTAYHSTFAPTMSEAIGWAEYMVGCLTVASLLAVMSRIPRGRPTRG